MSKSGQVETRPQIGDLFGRKRAHGVGLQQRQCHVNSAGMSFQVVSASNHHVGNGVPLFHSFETVDLGLKGIAF